jgi:hypothetical protein
LSNSAASFADGFSRKPLSLIHTASRAEQGWASDYSPCKLSRPELKAVQLTFLNCKDVEPSACIFINGLYLVEKPLIYYKETFLGAQYKL